MKRRVEKSYEDRMQWYSCMVSLIRAAYARQRRIEACSSSGLQLMMIDMSSAPLTPTAALHQVTFHQTVVV